MDFVIKALVARPVKHPLTICKHMLILRTCIEQTGLNTETGGYKSA